MKVVADEIGNLFSKETLLVGLVEKNLPPEFEHIRGLRDVIELKFHLNKDAPTQGSDVDWSLDTWAPYSCPIANVEMNGRYPFVVIRRQSKSKHSSSAAEDDRVNVISEKAFKQVGGDALQAEYGPFDIEKDVIKLVPNDVERLEMIKNLSLKRSLEKAEKKKRKAAKNSSSEINEESKIESSSKKSKGPVSSSSNHKSFIPKPSIGSQTTRNFLGNVKNEASKSLGSVKDDTFNKLFHGAGSQKPGSAQDQFIIQAGKRGNLG